MCFALHLRNDANDNEMAISCHIMSRHVRQARIQDFEMEGEFL